MLNPLTTYPRKPKLRYSGFTLIELLMVIAVIMILSGITFGITRGVQNAQNRSKAKVELITLAQALEQYKSRYGDYPWVADDPILFSQALLGWAHFENDSFVLKSSVPEDGPKPLIDISKLSYDGTLPPSRNTLPDDIVLLDPWGNSYSYYYKTSSGANWDNFGFVLYSSGPDGVSVPVGSDGILTTELREDPDNVDNLYSGE
ncbi:MAG: type II secretion system protein [Opitutales bacterium]